MESIIFIGPIGTGKTTVGTLVSQKLGIPFYSLDEEMMRYAVPLGYDDDHHERLKTEQDEFVAYDYRRTFYDKIVAQFLAAHEHGVLDFGGGHPIVPDPQKQENIKKSLQPYENIFLLMPKEDIQESLSILYKRNEITEGIADYNPLYFKDRTFWDIAKDVVYTKGKTPEETSQEIIDMLKSRSAD